ncbi:MAG: dioxygenase [Kordiimonadaceae bacterium]|nr:dioxygenase [Kordiimonadaceae bacterium]
MQPALFLSHGAPDLTLVDIPAARFLRTLFHKANRPAAIVILSAHWEEVEVEITTSPLLPTIHDFGGFPQALYDLQYPVKTEPWLIEAVGKALGGKGIQVSQNPNRGLDHGAWVPLLLAVPKADIPVVQVSLPYVSSTQDYFEFGRSLSALSAQNILIIGSGASVHNMRSIKREGTPPAEWAIEFTDWVETTLLNQNWAELFKFDQTSVGKMSHPTPEHFLPLIVAAGAGKGAGQKMHIRKLHDSYSYGSIGMSAWEFTNET